MITTGQSITNLVTGEMLVFRKTSADTNGEAVVVEAFVEPDGAVAAAHVHPAQEELLFFFEGEGEAVIDGESHPLTAGTTVYVGAGHRHKFVNSSAEDPLKMCWVMMQGGDDGLDDFFARIGRPRRAGEPAPAPFARPADVEQIEAATVFRKLD